jgi:hypothetical protein
LELHVRDLENLGQLEDVGLRRLGLSIEERCDSDFVAPEQLAEFGEC